MLLELRALKLYGLKLESILAEKPSETLRIMNNLINSNKTLELILKECLEKACYGKESSSLTPPCRERESPLIEKIGIIDPLLRSLIPESVSSISLFTS